MVSEGIRAIEDSAYMQVKQREEALINEVLGFRAMFEYFDENPDRLRGRNRKLFHESYTRLLHIIYGDTNASNPARDIFNKMRKRFGRMDFIVV